MLENITTINPLLKDIEEDVMGFLNEIQQQFPKAISLASGRPDDLFFKMNDFAKYFNIYVDSICELEKENREKITNSLGQYHGSKGIINDLISKYLEKDEEINVSPSDILVTVGTQEALTIAVITLCERDKDVIIVEDPTYIGITHFSKITGYEIDSVPIDSDGISLQILEQKILNYKNQGKNVKIVYVIPDYQNPTGVSMPVKNRYKLLAMSQKYNFLILEDNAYSEFIYEGDKFKCLKALDLNKRVIYLRSFSKTLFPSLRLGAMVANQTVNWKGSEIALSDIMATVKGYITVNTPSINQAILGGILIENNFSLKEFNRKKISNMEKKRNLVLYCINKFFTSDNFNAKEITWSIPSGGFFLTFCVPFIVDKNEVLFCAERYNLIFTPMSFFYLKDGGENEIRVAFSYIKIEEIEPAIERLSLYLKDKINNK